MTRVSFPLYERTLVSFGRTNLSRFSGRRESCGCGPKETVQVAFRATSLPHLGVHALEGFAAHHAHGDLVGKLLGLEKRMMREHPQVSELMCNRRLELIIGQLVEKRGLD